MKRAGVSVAADRVKWKSRAEIVGRDGEGNEDCRKFCEYYPFKNSGLTRSHCCSVLLLHYNV